MKRPKMLVEDIPRGWTTQGENVRRRRGARRRGAKSARIRGRVALLVSAVGLVMVHACAPVMPQRSKPGGALHWAETLARQATVQWTRDARLCRVRGLGVGPEGWLPDRGGTWVLTYWSPEHQSLFEVSVDSDGNVSTQEAKDAGHRGQTLPDGWSDSPRVWAAANPHLAAAPLSTFESEFAHGADDEAHPGQAVWRIRFFVTGSTFETHVVSADAKWLRRI